MEILGIKLRQGMACPLDNALASREIVLHCIQRPIDLDILAKMEGAATQRQHSAWSWLPIELL